MATPRRALALGIFRDVAPAGAAAAIDARLDGAITELSQRRMFSGNVGEIFMLPVGRHSLAAAEAMAASIIRDRS